MSDWSSGYVSNIGYTYGLYAELNPLRIKLAFLNAGLAFPEVGTACELGFGQGVSINMHAAASVTEWHGTDFNPSQAAFAQELATASDAHAQLHDQSFAEFCNRPGLPDFDFIGLHGIMRVRAFTQDDGHIFCTEDQIQSEVVAFTRLLQKVYKDFGFSDIIYKLSTRPEKRIGSEESWDRAEQALADGLRASGCDFEYLPGEGAFYGPKIEYTLKDALGRPWQARPGPSLLRPLICLGCHNS
eukprot:gene41136-50907_t